MNEKEADERKRPIYIYTLSLIDSNDEQYEVGPAHVYTRSHAYSSITLNIR